MARILIVHGGHDGQTRKIAEHIAGWLRDRQQQVEVADATTLAPGFSLAGFDTVVIGAAVRMARHPPTIADFVRHHRDALARRRSGFFSVCMAAASPRPDRQQQAQRWSEQFFRDTGWQPPHAAVFAGALRYRHYNFLLRLVMKRIARAEGVSTDTTRNHEYTDWRAVERFADEFASSP